MLSKPSNQSVALTSALLSASARLGLKKCELAKAVGLSDATLRRYARKAGVLRQGSKQWELAAMLIGAYQSASVLVGHDEKLLKSWTRSYNRAFNLSPGEAMSTVQGLVAVSSYLHHALSEA